MARYTTAAERRAKLAQAKRESDAFEARWRTMPARAYRDSYRPAAVRWGFSPVLHKTSDGVWRMGAVSVRVSGGRDWEGSCFAATLAHFERTSEGWQYNGTTYPTLLRAVRVFYTPEQRASQRNSQAAKQQ